MIQQGKIECFPFQTQSCVFSIEFILSSISEVKRLFSTFNLLWKNTKNENENENENENDAIKFTYY